MKEKITILGHANPDVDSILSGYILCSYLRYKRYNVDYVIPDTEISEDVQDVLKCCGVDYFNFPAYVQPQDSLILVDHHETKFSNNILAVIDHHPTIKEFDYPIYINKPASSTTKHIYDIIELESPDYISKRLIELVLIGLAVDTCSFRSSKTIEGDEKWFYDMCKKYHLNEKKIIKLGDSITNLSDISKATINGYKEFLYDNKLVGTSYIQTYGLESNTKALIINSIVQKVKESDFYMWVFMDVNLKSNVSKVYKIYKDKIEVDKYDCIVSRGKDVMPKIEKELCS